MRSPTGRSPFSPKNSISSSARPGISPPCSAAQSIEPRKPALGPARMKIWSNWRILFLLLLLAALGIREVALELRPSFLRPGLHLFAYVDNTADGTVTAVDLVRLASVATISVGGKPTGMRSHPTRAEIWGLSSAQGFAWVLDAKTNRIAARIPVGAAPYALDFSPDGARAYVAASGSNEVVEINCASRQVMAKSRAG